MSDEIDRALHHMNTAWHPLFILLIEHLVSRDWYRVIPELQLTREPLRLDALIVRKEREGAAPPPTHLHSVLDDLRDHNMVHFKGPSDELERADALQLLAYCAQSMILEGVYEPTRVSIRVVAPALTRRFTEQVEAMHGELRPTTLKGVYDGRLGVLRATRGRDLRRLAAGTRTSSLRGLSRVRRPPRGDPRAR